METSNPRQAVVDKLKKSTNILVTVAHDPSVDALAAALGFTLLLNKIDKHATAVFSGIIPPAITFLEPERTFEGTVDSLRDFIIALDKEKADRLRYKVEGDVVRIYITPYHTTITDKDLHYSQGDFNIDLVVALGVEKKADLDKAIVSHGRILHDASVVTINTTETESSVGSISWNDPKASSLCEMLMTLNESLKADVVDEQIATALLTGMVSATERFSNQKTSPKVMTMAAELMAAGANQQLIAEKLETEVEPAPAPVVEPVMPATTAPAMNPANVMPAEASNPVPQPVVPEPVMPAPNVDGLMRIDHEEKTNEQVAFDKNEYERSQAYEERLEQALGDSNPSTYIQTPAPMPEPVGPQDTYGEASPSVDQSPVMTSEPVADSAGFNVNPEPEPEAFTMSDWRDNFRKIGQKTQEPREPIMGGTLNATTDQAEKDKLAEAKSTFNHTILNHDMQASDEPDQNTDSDAPMVPLASSVDDNFSKGKTIQPMTMEPINSPMGLSYEETPFDSSSSQTTTHPRPERTIAELEAQVNALTEKSPLTSSIEDARQAVDSAIENQPLSVGGQPLPSATESSAMSSPMPDIEPLVESGAPAPTTSMPPMPDFSTLPPLPTAPIQDATPPVPSPTMSPEQQPVQTNVAPSPGQFQLPQ